MVSSRALYTNPFRFFSDEAYVAVMDVDDSDWWQIVNPEPEDFEPVQPNAIDEDSSYVMVQESELGEAITAFVTSIIAKYPECKGLKRLQSLCRSNTYVVGILEIFVYESTSIHDGNQAKVCAHILHIISRCGS